MGAGLTLLGCAGGSHTPLASAATPGAVAETEAFPDADPLEVRPFFVPGETLTWDVSFGGVAGGRARLAVGNVGQEAGRRLLVLRAEAESAGVVSLLSQTQDTLSSWFDVDAGVPMRSESMTSGKGKPTVVKAARADDQTTAKVTLFNDKTGDEGTSKVARLPSARTQDVLSTLLVLRGWKAEPGGRGTIYSLGGSRVWKNVFVVEGREVVDGRPAIRFRATAIRMSPTMTEDHSKPPRTFTVWLSDDAQRIPVRFSAHTEMGDVVAKITSYTQT